LRTSISFARRVPREWAGNVRVPTFLYQDGYLEFQRHPEPMLGPGSGKRMASALLRHRQAGYGVGMGGSWGAPGGFSADADFDSEARILLGAVASGPSSCPPRQVAEVSPARRS
jgi:hypothetical protein